MRACGRVFTGRYDTIALAWRLHLPIRRVEIFPYEPGTIFATRRYSLTRPRPSAISRDPRYRRTAGTEHWVVRSRCD